MGCKLSQLATSTLEFLDPFDRPSLYLPLTTKQQYSILVSWKGMFRQIENTGIILFVKLLEENEEFLHFFPFRKHRTKEAIVSSAELAGHATQVMHTLDEGIKGLADMDSFFSYVRHVGGTHRQVPRFKAENFMKTEQPFLEAAKTTLGERYTPNIKNIFKITIRFILENLVKGYEDAGQPNGGGGGQNSET